MQLAALVSGECKSIGHAVLHVQTLAGTTPTKVARASAAPPSPEVAALVHVAKRWGPDDIWGQDEHFVADVSSAQHFVSVGQGFF
jgi:hypothetical protein